MGRRWMAVIGILGGLLAGAATSAWAIPELQLYLEGATYDAASETWIVDNPSDGDVLRLWTIGNVGGPGSKGTIADVKLAVAYAHGTSPAMSLTPSTTGALNNFDDSSTPVTPTVLQTKTDGSIPLLGDGSPLASHGVYGAGTDWAEYSLGDFSLKDSPMANFIDVFPTMAPNATLNGQINVYEVKVDNLSEVDDQRWFHFDLYDHYQSKTEAKFVFAPFSHDGGTVPGGDGDGGGGGGGGVVPEPATLLLLGTGLLGLAGASRRNKARSPAA